MKKLDCILNDFYYLVGIPIKYFDKDWNNILSKGYDKNLDSYFDKFSILKECKENKDSYTKISYDNIHFLKFKKQVAHTCFAVFVGVTFCAPALRSARRAPSAGRAAGAGRAAAPSGQTGRAHPAETAG